MAIPAVCWQRGRTFYRARVAPLSRHTQPAEKRRWFKMLLRCSKTNDWIRSTRTSAQRNDKFFAPGVAQCRYGQRAERVRVACLRPRWSSAANPNCTLEHHLGNRHKTSASMQFQCSQSVQACSYNAEQDERTR